MEIPRKYSMTRLNSFILAYSKLQVEGVEEPVDFKLVPPYFQMFGEPSYKFWKKLRILEGEEYII